MNANVYHVVPTSDLREHETGIGASCWCSPRIEHSETAELHVHNSLDEREKFETGERKPS